MNQMIAACRACLRNVVVHGEAITQATVGAELGTARIANANEFRLSTLHDQALQSSKHPMSSKRMC